MDQLKPQSVKVSALNTCSDSRGFVSACEKASTATIRASRPGSGRFGNAILREKAGIELDVVDCRIEFLQERRDARGGW